MARPKVRVQHFLACRGVEVEGPVEPDNPYTLHGVMYRFGVSPDTEFPTDLADLWAFCRFVNLSDRTGRVEFSVEVVWLDGRYGEESACYYPGLTAYFRTGMPVASYAWRLRKVTIPGPGRYELRLSSGRTDRPKAVEYFQVGGVS